MPIAPPKTIPSAAWLRMPLAKRRLAAEGPADAGTDAARYAAITVAAELRLHGLSEEEAWAVVREMPFTTGSTPRHRVKKQLRRSVAFAYHPPDGQQILSGCCQDPRPRIGTATGRTLRPTFAAYCDEECARTCPMLRAIRNPGGALAGTDYEPLDLSDVWTHGTGLGLAGRRVWRTLALLALARGTDEIEGASRYVCLKLEGALGDRHIRTLLARMHALGIVTLLNKRTALRRVHVLDTDAVVELEVRLGVAGRRDANIRHARTQTDTFRDWLAERLDRHGDPDAAIAAWTF
jgi:hypothetical protein